MQVDAGLALFLEVHLTMKGHWDNKCAQLTANDGYVSRDGYVLPTIEDGDGQSYRIGRNHRTARPSLSSTLVVSFSGDLHFFHQV